LCSLMSGTFFIDNWWEETGRYNSLGHAKSSF
jgi:hypothetical protein